MGEMTMCEPPTMSVKTGETRKSPPFLCPTALLLPSCTCLLCAQYHLHFPCVVTCADSLQNQRLALNTRERFSLGHRAHCLGHSDQMFSSPSWCHSLCFFSQTTSCLIHIGHAVNPEAFAFSAAFLASTVSSYLMPLYSIAATNTGLSPVQSTLNDICLSALFCVSKCVRPSYTPNALDT